MHSPYLGMILDHAKLQVAVETAVRELAAHSVQFDAIAVTGNSGTIFGGGAVIRDA